MKLLIIGEMGGPISVASKIARDRGARVSLVPGIEEAIDALRGGSGSELIMADVRVADIKTLVQALKAERIHVPVVACGLLADSEAAVRAIKAGAKEFVPLPPDEALIAAVLEAITEETHTVIHASAAMHKMLEVCDQIAKSDASILITGESGTGKEVIARYVHRKSRRSGNPFISVNCAAIPETLLESELFGYEKGAFTGAMARRIGKFEEASGGTLLLDEVSEMDPRLQAKLLRALQEQEIDRLGGGKPVKVNIRVIATSNRDMVEAVKKGTFREDLYFRLNVINLHLPALRERKEDIKPLAEYFLQKYAQANGTDARALNSRALTKLEQHGWPGNVRELENTMHRAVLMASGPVIDADAVLLPVSTPKTQTPQPAAKPHIVKQDPGAPRNEMVGRSLESVERELILDTLNYCLGNRTHAANILGISIRTLRNKLRQYSLETAATGT